MSARPVVPFLGALILVMGLLVTQLSGSMPPTHATAAPASLAPAALVSPTAMDSPELLWRIAQPWGIVSVDPLTGNLWIREDASSFTIISPYAERLETWGTPGTADGEFDFRVYDGAANYGGSAFAADGTLYVVDSGNHRIQQFGPDRTFVRAWGSVGVGDGQFLVPREIAIDAQGQLYVTDEGRNDVQVFDRDGRFVRAFGEAGTGPGQLIEPAGVAIDRTGNVWVGDWGNHRVQKFSPEGEALGTIGDTGQEDERLGAVFGVAASAEGYIFVPEPDAGRVQVFDESGNRVGIWDLAELDDPGFVGPSQVAVDARGDLYISDTAYLRKVRLDLPLFLPRDPFR